MRNYVMTTLRSDLYKKLLELRKDKSPHTILICTDDLPDELKVKGINLKLNSLSVQ